MGRGVHLNENTYRKMSQNGLIEWQVLDGDKLHCFAAEHDRMTLQIREQDKPVHYAVLLGIKEPWKALNEYYESNKRVPRLTDQQVFMRAWKNQVKRKFNRSGWLRE